MKKALWVKLVILLFFYFKHQENRAESVSYSYSSGGFGDTVSFSLYAIGNGPERSKLSQILPKLQYNVKHGYPFYQFKKRWKVGETYQLGFHQLPTTGFLYVFAIDGANNAIIKEIVEIDSMTFAEHMVYQSNPSSISFAGQEHICVWYSKAKIEGYEKKITAIELTKGDFVQRCNAQLGGDLLQPDRSWYFAENKMQFITRSPLLDTGQRRIVSIILELDISN